MPKSRLGRRERLLRREQWAIFNTVKAAVIQENLDNFQAPVLAEVNCNSRDETPQLKRNCHTQGIRIGSQLAPVERPTTERKRMPNVRKSGPLKFRLMKTIKV